jgi:transcriptional regulator with XRE-family HTH domain
LSAAVTSLRTVQGLDKKEIARGAHVKPETVSAWERGDAEPDPDNLDALAPVFGLTRPGLDALADLFDTFPSMVGAPGLPGAEETAVHALRLTALLTRAAAVIFDPVPPPRSALSTTTAAELWARLEPYPPKARRAVVREGAEFQTWSLAELLCRESAEAAAGHPDRAVELADLACCVAEQLAGRGRPQAAEEAFEVARRELLGHKNAYGAALISLELAVFYLAMGRTAEVKQIAAALLPVVAAEKVARESLGAVNLFCAAVRQDTMTVSIARRCLEDLRRVGR